MIDPEGSANVVKLGYPELLDHQETANEWREFLVCQMLHFDHNKFWGDETLYLSECAEGLLILLNIFSKRGRIPYLH